MHDLTIVCPVDYSDCSKRALRFAGALADHFRARLVVLHVFDPLLAGTAALHQVDLAGADGRQELQSFVEAHFPVGVGAGKLPDRLLAVGPAARKILEAAEFQEADLLVMGTHGFRGARKAVFGSTLQRVLRRARVPVLAVPILDHPEAGIQAPLISSGPVLAPVDFSPQSRAAARVAAGLARALGLPLLLLHAMAPPNIVSRGWQYAATPGDRVALPEPALLMGDLAESLGSRVPIESRIVAGEPAEQIARLARDKRCSAIVMSLGSSSPRRPGSIACRVLCQAAVPVLALPETAAGRLYLHYLDHAGNQASAF